MLVQARLDIGALLPTTDKTGREICTGVRGCTKGRVVRHLGDGTETLVRMLPGTGT